MAAIPRVAFFTDTYAEINGVALTSRQLTSFARRHGFPFLCVRGSELACRIDEDSTIHVEIPRGPLSFNLDKGLRHDPALWRHGREISRMVSDFNPDIVHVVSPGDVSEIGVYIARRLKLPLAISWHTNLHEFGAMRLAKLMSWTGINASRMLSRLSEKTILEAMIRFYKLGDVLYAPNDELVEMLRRRTRKPVFLMKRGIDTNLFTPAHRTVGDGILRLGYVGRTTPEKNVRFLKKLETGLLQCGVPPFRFLIVGDGSEREWLYRNLAEAEVPGILRGESLAEAYANMDVFVFPSRTDTFGNVVLEAFASGVSSVVTDAGGPKFIVRHDETGFVATSEDDFIARTAQLLRDATLRRRMACAAREYATAQSWDTVFERLYEGYRVGIAARAAN